MPPVISTWPSRSHSMVSVPSSRTTSALRSTRPRRPRRRPAAQAPEPQASVRPAPRSQTRSSQPVRAHHLGDADIGALGKERIVLELRAELGERDRRRDRRRRTWRADCPCWCRRDPATDRAPTGMWLVSQASRTGMSRQSRRGRAHVDRDHRQAVGARAGLLRFEQAGDGLHRHLVGLALVHHHRGDAARGVAAGAGLAAVGIVDAHEDVGLAIGRRLEHDQLVAADAQPAVGDGAAALDRQVERRRAAVEHDEIVAQPVHLEERRCTLMRRYMAVRPGQRNERGRTSPACGPPSSRTSRVASRLV